MLTLGFMVDPAKFNVDTDTLVQFLRTQPTFLAHKETQDNSPGTPGLLITSLSVRLFYELAHLSIAKLQLVKVMDSAGKANHTKTSALEGECLAGGNRWCIYFLHLSYLHYVLLSLPPPPLPLPSTHAHSLSDRDSDR